MHRQTTPNPLPLSTPSGVPAGESPSPHAPSAYGSARLIASSTLLGPSGCVDILHNGERYILRQTRAGKLILTK